MASRRFLTLMKDFVKSRHLWKLDSFSLSRNFGCLSTYEAKYTNPLTSITLLNWSQTRNYPKGKDKVKTSGKKVQIREDLLAEHMNLGKFKMELEDELNLMKEQFIKNVSLRSSAGAIEELVIEFEGEKYTIRDLAQINRKNPKLVALSFSNFPQTIPTVLQTLNESGMNLNPQQDGVSVFIPIPKVTREHRESLAKNANKIFNKCKTSLKEIQTKYLKRLEVKKEEGLSEELFFILRDQVTALVQQFVSEAEKITANKTKELLGDS